MKDSITTPTHANNGEEHFTQDTPFTLVHELNGKEISRVKTTLDQEIERAGGVAVEEYLSDMISRRLYAIETPLRGLVDLLINELDKYGLPMQRRTV